MQMNASCVCFTACSVLSVEMCYVKMGRLNCFNLVLLVSAITVFHVSSSKASRYEGAPCTSRDGPPGVCRKASNCPAAQDDNGYRRLPSPVLCRFDQKDPIVCCSNTEGVPSMKIVCAAHTVNDSVTSRAKRKLSIYGGSNVFSQEYPHMAAVGFVKRGRIAWLCGGTLIHKRFVLTAAHCLEDTSIYRYGKPRFVRLGDIDLKSSADDVNVQMLSVVRRIRHPQYKPSENYHDIALLQLDNDVTFDSFVKPACLHSQDTVPHETPIATGWGRTEKERRSTGQKLLKVNLEFQPMQKCNSSLSEQADPVQLRQALRVGLLEDSMLCAGVLEGGRDSCQGDSGGPLQVKAHSPMCDFDVVGVISFGLECAKADTPAVYSRVSKYVPWIESVVCSYTDRS